MYRDDEKGEEVALDAVRSQQPQMSTGLVGDGREQIRAMEFNQDASCIALGTNDGFRVFIADPLQCQFERRELGPIKLVELLFRNQIVALVGGP